jgi:NAD(P)-dependent dehydrogenase (short-subunit alcohol dehydrogenase family)
MSFAGKVAVIIGGGTGIGAATAKLLAAEGADIVVAGRREEPLELVVAAAREAGARAVTVVADLSLDADARSVVDRAVSEFGRLDCAVNAAGSAAVGTLVDTDEPTFDEVFATNVKTAWLAMKYEIPALVESGGGAIVNVASRAGLTGVAHGAVYSAAKHAVVGLTKSAALENAALGIRINAVCPGPTATQQFDDIVSRAMPGSTRDEAAAALGSKIPLGRIAAPAEIAATIVWLLGASAGYMTGAVVPVDGGSGAG